MVWYLLLHRLHLLLFFELTFVGVLEISIEEVLPFGLGALLTFFGWWFLRIEF